MLFAGVFILPLPSKVFGPLIYESNTKIIRCLERWRKTVGHRVTQTENIQENIDVLGLTILGCPQWRKKS